MNTNEKDEKDEKDENFMIFKLEDLDLEYSNKYIYQENNIENNYKYICYNNNYNINKDLLFKLPRQIDPSEREIYILSNFEKKTKYQNKIYILYLILKAKHYHC